MAKYPPAINIMTPKTNDLILYDLGFIIISISGANRYKYTIRIISLLNQKVIRRSTLMNIIFRNALSADRPLIAGINAKAFFNPQQLIVFRHTV